jgi:hypothetical protein
MYELCWKVLVKSSIIFSSLSVLDVREVIFFSFPSNRSSSVLVALIFIPLIFNTKLPVLAALTEVDS